MDSTCIEVSGLSKKFSRSLKRSLVYGAQDLFRESMGMQLPASLRPSEFWALSDISFSLEQGKSLGIVGLNGSGKTTLLRVICGVINATSGTVRTNGRIAPLLALGAGFKPVLSGRENVFLNLSLLGVPAAEIARRFDSIVDFAGLEEAIDMPLGMYSSGMRARLGFACAVHTAPSLLVVDEVLSVGDAKFRAKCRNRINELRKGGTSMLLVSHSAISIETLCDQCLYLVKGKVAAQGDPVSVLERYESDAATHAADANALALSRHSAPVAAGEGSVFEDIEILSGTGMEVTGYWRCSEPGRLSIKLKLPRLDDDISVNAQLTGTGENASEICQLMASSQDIGWLKPEGEHVQVLLDLPAVVVKPGTYRLKLSVSSSAYHDILDVVDNLKLVVKDKRAVSRYPYFQPRNWSFQGAQVTEAVQPEDEYDESDESF